VASSAAGRRNLTGTSPSVLQEATVRAAETPASVVDARDGHPPKPFGRPLPTRIR
jgi:hypothetical protein